MGQRQEMLPSPLHWISQLKTFQYKEGLSRAQCPSPQCYAHQVTYARVGWPWASMWRHMHRSRMGESVTLLQFLLAWLWHPVMSLTQIPKLCINTPISTPWERSSCRRCGYKCLQGKVDTPGMQDSNNTHSLEPAMDWNMVRTSSGQSRKCATGLKRQLGSWGSVMSPMQGVQSHWSSRSRGHGHTPASAEDMNTCGPLRAPAQMCWAYMHAGTSAYSNSSYTLTENNSYTSI